jgi:hypothetical protein
MVLDHERCNFAGCAVHVGLTKGTPTVKRNQQIRDDWRSGLWTVEELSSFWGLMPLTISTIVTREADRARAGTPPLEVTHSR